MTNTEINRQIVQQGLARRAAQRREAREDARHDAAERSLHRSINANKITRQIEADADQIVMRRTAEQIARDNQVAATRRKKRKAQREAAKCCEWYRFLIRCFIPLAIAVLLVIITINDMLPFLLTYSFIIVACMIGIDTFATRFLHPTR